ncbi:unnamed protein product [Owenia fusiformis]|uniref:sphingomyelin phosphodiesterase n=1 Tax=Owenia fusiformis TaxID=6347 RepID=A0A8S4NB12_OWEFU|nr:unnamed protein product [Owenia fusiformis]
MNGAGDVPYTNSNHNQCKQNLNQHNQHSLNQHNQHNLNQHNQHNLNQHNLNNETNPVDFDHNVLTSFPQLDILCIQETWNKGAARSFARELHRYFPFIIYDAYVHGWTINKLSGTSGIMIASKHPILDAKFEHFKSSVSQDVLSSKGLLMVKVDLGLKSGTNKRVVGYASTTHMQAYQNQLQESDSDTVHHQQLSEVASWTRCFRDNTFSPESEIIAFDVLTGDFNLDNMSPVDKEDYEHTLFDDYRDVVRIRPGLDHPWSKGTEMRHIPLYDTQVSTAEGLKEALEDPYMLQHHVLDADVESATLDMCTWMPKRDDNGNPILSKVGGRRRIDYLLYRNEDNLRVTSYNFVTQLAKLTDHIPVSFTFSSDMS